VPLVSQRPQRVYVCIGAVQALAGTVVFSITNIYRYRVAGLDAFQLVVVGSAMEAAVFVFEIPTGVVADLFSRKWSVVIGHLGMGVAFLVEATFASFAGVLAAQVLWGLAYTFTSGATVAWVSMEMDDPDDRALSTLFLRTSSWSSAAALVGVPLAFGLAAIDLRIPLVLGGVISIGLGLGLIGAMSEHGFRRSDERTTWRSFATSTRSGLSLVRRSRVLVLVAIFIAVAGGSSEAYDRFVERHLLETIGVPSLVGRGPLFGLAVLFSLSSLLGIVIPRLVRRRRPNETRQRLTRWLVTMVLLQVVALVVFGLTGSFLVAAVAAIVIERSRSIRNSLFGSWIVPLTPKATRATALSTLAQFDAIGQVAVGPMFGVIGRIASVPAAIVTSAAVLAPGAPLIAHARRDGVEPEVRSKSG
jgi:MFS transporter, DHA3 family, tetracycline resistance protein